MCGIFGLVDRYNPAVAQGAFEQALELMTHRGPDDYGIYQDGNLMIGHKRLSIIDLRRGHQPMGSADGRAWIVFNGEIYNYQSLRDELVGKGFKFRTASDTEVILNLYLDQGKDCVRRLNGIFAFAIWNSQTRSLFIARDHMGVKPLYFVMTPGGLVFSSEVKSLFCIGLITPKYDPSGVAEYFVFRDLAGDRTLFKGVRRLLPGHLLIWTAETTSIKEYWSPLEAKERFQGSFEDAVEGLDQLLGDAVRMQMISDVPLGTFCSGGLDSSLVTAYAAKAAPGPINTFSVGFHERGYDETDYARKVSRCYQTSHHEIKVSNNEFAGMLEHLIWHNDEPLHFANSVHIYAISRLARQFVTVVLTGEGSDELFAGYPRYQVPEMLQFWRKLPFHAQLFLKKLMLRRGDHRIEKLSRYDGLPLEMLLSLNSATMSPETVMKLFDTAGWLSEYRLRVLRKTIDSQDPVHRLSLLDQQTYLVSILNRQDKMSMAASIESRVPFLDTRVVEFANSLPRKYKQRFLVSKRVVKEVGQRHLPKMLVQRRKSGFGVPLAKWFRESTGLGRLSASIERDEHLEEIFGRDWLRKVREEHRSGQADHSDFLWTALSFALWRKVFLCSKWQRGGAA